MGRGCSGVSVIRLSSDWIAPDGTPVAREVNKAVISRRAVRYTSNIATSRQLRKILVGFPEEWLAELDRIAVREGKARAQVIRDAVRKLLEADRKAEARR